MSLDLIVGGITYSVSDGVLTWLEGYDGMGMAPVNNLFEVGPMQQGASYVDYRLQPRVVSLVLGADGASQAGYWTRRSEILRLVKPGLDIKLRWTLANGDVRQLDCRYNGQMSLPSGDRQGFYQRVGTELIAFNPLFYDPTQNALSFQVSGIGNQEMEVPLAIPWKVGSTSVSASVSVAYVGTADEFPRFRVYGPIDDLVITNDTTGETLSFVGDSITTGHYYDIDLRYGYKTVLYDSTTTSKLSKMLTTSDLATFHLASAEDGTESRVNDFTVTGSGTGAATKIWMYWYSRYIGI